MKLFSDPMWDRYFQPQGSGLYTGAMKYSPGGPDNQAVPTSQTVGAGAGIDGTGSVTNLEAVVKSADEWSAGMLPWVDRFDAFVESKKSDGTDAHNQNTAKLQALQAEWGRQADNYQLALDSWLKVLNAGASNVELMVNEAARINALAANEKAAADAAWAAGDRAGAQLHLDAATEYLNFAEQWTGAARTLTASWRAADDAVRASQRVLEQAKQSANRAVNRQNAAAETNWGVIALLVALIIGGSVLGGAAVKRL